MCLEPENRFETLTDDFLSASRGTANTSRLTGDASWVVHCSTKGEWCIHGLFDCRTVSSLTNCNSFSFSLAFLKWPQTGLRGCVWAACGPLATIWIGMLYSFTLTFTPVVDVKWPILIPNLHGFWTVVEEISVLEPGCDPHCCKASELTPTLLFDPLTTNRTRTLLFSVTTS